MTSMENAIVNALNTFFLKNKIQAEAYRLYQSEYSLGQKCDIIVDSLQKSFYLALECKSMNAAKGGTFNFKSRFTSDKNETHQLEREHHFCQRSGRTGYIVIELRNGPGKPKTCSFIPMDYVYQVWKSGAKSLKVDEIRTFPMLKREKGVYVFDEGVLRLNYQKP